MTKEKVKKPFYKKWWVWVAAIIIISMVTPSEEEETTFKQTEEKVAETSSKPADNSEKDKQKEEEEKVEKQQSEPKKEEEPKQEKADTPLTSGENGILSDDVFIGLGEDKENYDEMFTYITKGNQDALMNMMLEGKVSFAEKGTPITVIDRGFINAKVQVIETGDRGWVPVEYLARDVE